MPPPSAAPTKPKAEEEKEEEEDKEKEANSSGEVDEETVGVSSEVAISVIAGDVEELDANGEIAVAGDVDVE